MAVTRYHDGERILVSHCQQLPIGLRTGTNTVVIAVVVAVILQRHSTRNTVFTWLPDYHRTTPRHGYHDECRSLNIGHAITTGMANTFTRRYASRLRYTFISHLRHDIVIEMISHTITADTRIMVTE